MATLTQPAVGYPENGIIERDLSRDVKEMKREAVAVVEDDTTDYTEPSLGLLGVFPLEILLMIVSDIDLESLTRFRSASRGTKIVTESITKLTSIYTFAPRVLQAVVSLGAGSWMTCDTLREVLSTKACDACGNPASLLYTLTCKRVCPMCFTSSPSYPTSFAKFAQSLCSLDDDDLQKLRTITILEKNGCANELHPPFSLVNKQEVIEVALQHTDAHLDHILRMIGDESEYGTETDHHNDAASDAGTTVSERADLIGSIVFFGGAIRAPYVDFSTGLVDWGTCCSACSATGRTGRDKMDWTDAQGWKDAKHLKECEGAMTILGYMDYCQHVARTASGDYAPPENEE